MVHRVKAHPDNEVQTEHLFLDTNVLLHYQFDAIKWRGEIQAESICIHIVPSVLDEVAVKKDMGEPKALRKRAGKVAKRLLEYLDSANQYELRDGENLLFDSETPKIEDFPKLLPSSKDDQLIASALIFARDNFSKCYIVTGDSSLTLRVKVKQWPLLGHLAAPDSFKLPEQPDSTERALQEAQKQLYEARQTQPELTLTFLNGEDFIRLKPTPININEIVPLELSDLRGKKKPLPVVSAANSMMRATLGTPEQIRVYNEALESYFKKYEVALRQGLDIRRRTIQIQLKVTNDGHVPAESVLLSLHFPDGFKLVKADELEDEYPDFPREPQKPGIGDALLRASALRDDRSLFSAFRPAHPL